MVKLHNDEKVKRSTILGLKKRGHCLGFGLIFRCANVHGTCGGSGISDVCPDDNYIRGKLGTNLN